MSTYRINIGEHKVEANPAELNELDWVFQNGKYHLLLNNKAYQAELISIEGKKVELLINNNKYEIIIEDELDQLMDQMGLNAVVENKINEIKAPMPGVILDLLVQEGDSFEKGQALLILEAMKMENVIKAEGGGTVKTIKCLKGETVEKNAIIIELE